MTWPITPLASIHVDPTALAAAEQQFRASYTALMNIFEKLPAEIIEALVNKILTTFGFGAVTGDVDTLLTALEHALLDIPQGNIAGLITDLSTAGSALVQALRDAVCNALGVPGSGHTDADVLSSLQNIPGAVISGVTNVEQNLIDAISNALGHAGTGHTTANIASYLLAIPGSVITGSLNTAVTISGNSLSTLFNSSGLIASQITGALNTAVTVGGTTLATLIPGGQLAASQLTGGLNTAITISGNALSTLFNSSGVLASQLTGGINTAVTFGGTALSTLFTNLNSTGQFAASGLTGALNTAVTISGTAVATLLQYLNGSGQFNAAQITGALNNAVTFGGTALSTVLQYITPSTGVFDAAHIAGAVNTAVTISGNAISTLFSGSGILASQLTGALNGAVTFGGTSFTTLLTNINSSGQFAASAITGALNTAVTIGGTALSTLIPAGQLAASQLTGGINTAVTLAGTALGTLATNWNAGISNLASLESQIISTLSGIGSGISGVGAALAAIPFLNVLSPWLANIGAGIMAFADSIVSGLNLETTTGNNPAQAGQAGTLIANAVNSATTIAQSVAATIAAQAISNPAYFGVDPTAAVAYPLQTLAGTTAPTINVTASTPAAIYIDTPYGGLAKSVAWLGDGTLTGITGMYINVYSVNTSTSVATWMWSSNNIIAAVSGGAVPLWNYANIPLANYIQTAQGQKYVAEIQVLGSGTYKIIGITGNWLNANTAVTIQTQGATRTPVTKLASVTSNSGATAKNPSWTLTTVTNDNCVMVDLGGFSNTSDITAMSVTCGGVAMTQKSFTAFNTIAIDGASLVVAQYELHNTAFAAFSTGAKTVTVTTTGGGTTGTQCAVQGVAASYQSISAVGSATATTGNSTNPTQTVTGLTANSAVIVHSLLSAAASNFSANNQNLIANINGAAATAAVLVQDQLPYATSVPFTGTAGTSGKWGASVVPLTVTRTTPLQVPASTFTPTGSNNLPWFAMCGSAGVSQVAAKTQKFLAAGSATYTVPTQFQAAAAAGGTVKFDIVVIGAGGGGTYATTSGPSEFGGSAGSWSGITLTYGAGGGIPLTTTSFSVSIGAGGAYGNTGDPSPGHNGAGTTVTITGYGTVSTTGGTGSGQPDADGASPGNYTFNSTIPNYNGGLETPWTGEAPGGVVGSAPGGGGPFNAAGAPGAAFITAYQA